MPQRDRSRDGLKNTLTFLALTSGRAFWHIVQSSPFERLANWGIVNNAIKYAPFRPNPLSTEGDFSSWSGLTDRTYFSRHLKPSDRTFSNGPDAAEVAKLFLRDKKGRASHKSTAILTHFAQWFTDGFMRSDFRGGSRAKMKNSSNHEIDLCNLYGLNAAETEILREHHGGRLKSQTIRGEEFPPFLYRTGQIAPEFAGLPPLFAGRPITLRPGQQDFLFATGTDRGNVTTGYAMMTALFLREHNRIADLLTAKYPAWGDERVFQTTRNIMIVLLLKIVVEDYVNHIAPYHFKLRMVAGRQIAKAWHRPNWVALEFNLLYRWHSLMPNVVLFGDQSVDAQDTQINNSLLVTHGLKAAFEGASNQAAGEIGLFNTPDYLYKRTELMSIETARANNLATFNDYREWCKFPRATAFDQISSRPEVLGGLRTLYKTVDQVELYPGLFAEDLRPNSVLGPLMGRMVGIDALSQALTNPLLSEHLYNKDTFSEEGLDIIENKTRTLSDVVQRNIKGADPVSFTQASFRRTRGWQRPPDIALP